jgi:hypothetical protein
MVSTEVVFLLRAEDGIFDEIHGIPRNFAEFRGIFTVKFREREVVFMSYTVRAIGIQKGILTKILL